MKFARWAGLGLALLSAASFGTSGVFAKGLLNAGWSPAAAAVWRVSIGTLVLLPLASRALRGRRSLLHHHYKEILLFGVVAVAGCQLAYYLAVAQLSVAVALLLEYCGVVLVVAWPWLRQGQRPTRLTVMGAGVALVGLVLVLGIVGGSVQLNPIGVWWGLVAAVCMAAYFLVAAHQSDGGLPPVVLATGGLLVGAITLGVAGMLGLVDMHWTHNDVIFSGLSVPWWLSVIELGVLAAAVAYLSGVAAARRLGSTVASFVSLSEVLFTALWAWLLLAETPSLMQQIGGLAVLVGVFLVRLGAERSH